MFYQKTDFFSTGKNDRKFLEKIEDRIKKQRGRELPRFINYQACEDLVKDIVEKFKPAAAECLRTVNEVVGIIFATVAHHSANQCYDLERAIKVNMEMKYVKTSADLFE